MAIQSILIPAQESAEALTKALAQTLQEALGEDWTYSDESAVTVTNSSGLGIELFTYSSRRTDIYLINSQSVRLNTNVTIEYTANNSYYLDIQKNMSGAFAIGYRKSDAAVKFNIACVKNNKSGIWNILRMYSNTCQILNTNENKEYSFTYLCLTNSAFSMCKAPDIRQGGLFDELYIVLSAPVSVGSLPSEVSFDGKKYVIITGSSGGACALLEA